MSPQIDLILALAAAAIEGKRLTAVHQVAQLVDRLEQDGDATSADRLRRVLAECGAHRGGRQEGRCLRAETGLGSTIVERIGRRMFSLGSKERARA